MIETADLAAKREAEHMERNHLSIRMDKELHDRFQYAADYEGRSMSRQILCLIQNCIREFEKERGPITAGELEHGGS